MNDDKQSLLDAIYDPSEEELQFVDISLNLSTLLVDRINTACQKTNLSRDTFLSVAIVRALIDYEQYSNRIL
ncbi:MAG: hypothetical protein Q8R86_06175 [Sulfuricurvum sp.]|nr:hypothetical protein [Sulfuricurvum sp.]